MPFTAFSKELREHCMRIGSIARVCKGTGINRQQFNKYLAGQTLPSARNMWKICDYLGVSVEHLMVDQATAPPGENSLFNSEIDFSAISVSFRGGGRHAQGNRRRASCRTVSITISFRSPDTRTLWRGGSSMS